jgi:hypothetical protein
MNALRRAAALAALAATLAAGCDFFDPLTQGGFSVVALPRDTTVYVGGQFQLRALMVNRFGDEYPSSHFTFSGLDPIAAVSGAGVVTGVAFGRARAVVSREQLADTSWTSVVPSGALAVTTRFDSTVLFTVNLDGSASMRIGRVDPGVRLAPVAWLPANAGLVYQALDSGPPVTTALYVNDLAGHVRLLETLAQEPRASRDGAWVYFVNVLNGGAVWRVHPDGTGAQQITAAAGGFAMLGDPDPSPDGTQVAYWRDVNGSPDTLYVRNVASGVERALVVGQTPRWAPSGSQLAYWGPVQREFQLGGAIYVVNADGTGARLASTPGRNYLPGSLDWSPDGRWLIARSDSTLDLIEPATGLTLPISWSANLAFPAWRW